MSDPSSCYYIANINVMIVKTKLPLGKMTVLDILYQYGTNKLLLFLVFDFCRFCVVIRFSHPRLNGQWPPTSKDFYTRSYPSHYLLILILEKEPVFPISVLRKLLVLVLDWGLNPGPPVLDAGTLPLGYRGGGWDSLNISSLMSINTCL